MNTNIVTVIILLYTTLFHRLLHQVLQVARNYFGCGDLPFVPLENGVSTDGMR